MNTISIPTSVTITDNKTLLIAIKAAIGSGLTSDQKKLLTIKTTYGVGLTKGTAKIIKISVEKGTTIDLMVTHSIVIQINKTQVKFLELLNTTPIDYWDGFNGVRWKPVLATSARFVKDDKDSGFTRFYFHAGLNNPVPQVTLTDSTIVLLGIEGITTMAQLDAKIQENHKETVIKDQGAHSNHSDWGSGYRYNYYFKVTKTSSPKITLHYSYRTGVSGIKINGLFINFKTA